jgi:hypothetical protein
VHRQTPEPDDTSSRADADEEAPLWSDEALSREAEAADGPTSNRWRDARPDERPGILENARSTRKRAAEQETASTRPLTEDEERHLADIAAIQTMEDLGARFLSECRSGPPEPLLLDRLDPIAHSILYGTGAVGKGLLAACWVARLTALGHRVVIIDYEGHSEEWARRVPPLSTRPERSVVMVAPLSAAWKGKRGPIWESKDDIGRLVEAYGGTYVVIDSVVTACGGADVTKPETCARYAEALQRFDRPVLSLAHMTKTDDDRYPFGSIFWHNLARVTWSLERGGTSRLLTPHKANNYPLASRYAVTVEWEGGLPISVTELPLKPHLNQLIVSILADGPQEVEAIVAALGQVLGTGVKADSVRAALRRGRDDGLFREADGLWGLA